MRTKIGLFCVALVGVALAAPPASAHGSGGHGRDDSKVRVLLEGLSSPKGLAVNEDANLVIAQGAFGPPGPVKIYDIRGRDKGTVTDLTEPFGLTDITISPKDATGFALSTAPEDETQVHLYHRLADGTIVDVLNITAYQATDPDPVDHDDPPNPIESNPYGLASTWKGDVLIADAAGNDVIRVKKDGTPSTVARFDLQNVGTDHVPPGGPFPPLPPTFDAEAVPTTVTVGPDGYIYVGELKGFPFRPGTSNIWRIRPNAEGAWCSVNEPDPTGQCKLYSSGYTGIQDIAFGDNGKLYVYELAAGGVLAFEAALDPEAGVPFPPAVLLEVKVNRHGDKRRELVAGELSQPGGVVVVHGKVYVTDGLFTAGRLLRIDR